jgi:sugar phosphate isomerase/epimerase
MERLGQAIEIARNLGASSVLVGGGSVNPNGRYWPHPDNYTSDTRHRLIKFLREVAPVAESKEIVLSLEGHVLTPLTTPEITREIVDAIGSEFIRTNLDPVNYVSDPMTLYASRILIDRVIDLLADVSVGGHVKDVILEDRLVVHLEEVPLGDGVFDVPYFLERFQHVQPDGYLMVEHLPESEVPRAKATLDRMLKELSIEVT